jgi:hypothetical protein
MTKLYKLRVATLTLLLSALIPLVANAQQAPNFALPRAATIPPKVVDDALALR